MANEETLTTLKTEVDGNTQDIADIMTDYAKTAGGNTIAANSVAIANADGKLTSVTGTAGQVIGFSATGVPEAQTPAGGTKPYNKSADVTLPVASTSPTTVTVPGMPANAAPFMILPRFSEWTNQPRSWHRLLVVTNDTAGQIVLHHTSPIEVTVPFTVYWTE
ncbi:MAG TPA: hypothetical protein DCW90_10375 [Lachnospiraceae bacterium]|nr:hypothetical protein [Lachnospiraceae bacterium]